MIISVDVPLALIFLFQTEQVYPSANMGGIDNVYAIRNEGLTLGLLHHLIELFLKAFRAQSGPEAAEGRKVGGKFFPAFFKVIPENAPLILIFREKNPR